MSSPATEKRGVAPAAFPERQGTGMAFHKQEGDDYHEVTILSMQEV
jgi:hypothetical protein